MNEKEILNIFIAIWKKNKNYDNIDLCRNLKKFLFNNLKGIKSIDDVDFRLVEYRNMLKYVKKGLGIC